MPTVMKERDLVLESIKLPIYLFQGGEPHALAVNGSGLIQGSQLIPASMHFLAKPEACLSIIGKSEQKDRALHKQIGFNYL